MANILKAAGYDVTREYYVNDAGNQMEAFYRSLLTRYKETLGVPSEMPPNGYMGGYVAELANEIADAEGRRFLYEEEIRDVKYIVDIGRGKKLE